MVKVRGVTDKLVTVVRKNSGSMIPRYHHRILVFCQNNTFCFHIIFNVTIGDSQTFLEILILVFHLVSKNIQFFFN